MHANTVRTCEQLSLSRKPANNGEYQTCPASKFSLPVVLSVLAELRTALEPACLRVVAGGSVRREHPEVGDGTHTARASAATEKHPGAIASRIFSPLWACGTYKAPGRSEAPCPNFQLGQCPLAMEKKPSVMPPKEYIESQARARAQQMKMPADEAEGGKDSSCGVIEGSFEIRHSAS